MNRIPHLRLLDESAPEPVRAIRLVREPMNRRAVAVVLEPADDEVEELNFDGRNYPTPYPPAA